MATTPLTHPLIYGFIVLGGVRSPGTVKLSGFDREHDWEEQKPKGTTGVTTVNKGPKNSGFTAVFTLVSLEEIAEWDTFQALIASTVEGPTPRALPVFHPDLVRNKIVDVVSTSIGGLVHAQDGGMSVTCKFIEYRPPKPRPAKVPGRTGVTTVDTASTRVDPNAAAKRELAALLEQAKSP